ncbi:MAG: bifunctional isocitrate dehydrogenase kinase/phosphatase [Candidatus Bathyarchaeota archaeon]
MSASDLPDSTMVLAIARAMLEGFDNHYRRFRACASQAKGHFERGEWQVIQDLSRERIDFYDQRVAEATQRLDTEFDLGRLDESIWPQLKLQYVGLLIDHEQPECAETFFNSVSCKILHRKYFHNQYLFVRPTIATEHLDSEPPAYRSYYPHELGLRATLGKIVADFGLERPFADLGRDIRYLLESWRDFLPRPFKAEFNHQIQVLSSLFFRNQKACIVGRLINGSQEYPFVVPILRDARGDLFLDAILLEADLLDSLFSANRAYFLVDMEVPAAYVEFLQKLLPHKPKAELYTIIGLQKHGKNLFYRDLLQHLRHSSDTFISAPGIRGQVMAVFTLRSFPYVFKLIKDLIAPQKNTDAETVKRKYWLVKHHDRAGRLADTLEYSDVALPRARFDPAFLEELRSIAGSRLEEDGDVIFIKHVYIEPRMVPLNLFLETSGEAACRAALHDYGLALRQLALANIFPGDLLFKNFGVTRNGRVVFYDYDEIDYLTNCNFRRLPPPRNPEDELSGETWFPVGEHDVFPEEFARFLLTDPRHRAYFLEEHADLFNPEYWSGIKERILSGQLDDVFLYPQAIRFCHRFGGC